jgi:hypothetical protein
MWRKQVFPYEGENDLAEHCLVVERKVLGLTMTDVMCLAYQLAVRNGIKNHFAREMKILEEKFPTSSSRNLSYNP